MPKFPANRIRAVSLAILFVFGSLPSALAGDGTIRVSNNPDGTLDEGVIEARIYVDLPRTTEQYAAMEEQLRGANRLICDYTNGLFRLGELRYVHHPADRRTADVLWFRRYDRARADAGSFGTGLGPNPSAARGNLRIYATEHADTIAHELGHLVFGALDQYPDQRAVDEPIVSSTNIDSPDTFVDPLTGAEFFRSLVYLSPGATPQELRERLVPGPVAITTMGTPLYPNGPLGEPWWLVNNSMMQQSSGQTCRDANGLSPSQVNPLVFSDLGCVSDADADGDGVADDCAALVSLQCTAGVVGNVCAISSDCDSAPGAGDGLCTLVGFPHCGVGDVNTSSELTALLNNDLNRFNRTTGAVESIGSGMSQIREARHLVLQGYLYPTNQAQPQTGRVDDRPCYDRDADFSDSPDGMCLAECNPAIVSGDAAWSTQCDVQGRSAVEPCPFSSLPGSPNNPACTVGDNPLCTGTLPVASTASCDQCVLGNSEACVPMFGTALAPGAGGAFCGDGSIDTAPSPLPADPAMWNLVEQCDNGSAATGNVPDPSVPLDNPTTGMPLRCADLGDWLPTGDPDPSLVGGLVHCQANCFLDLSRCAPALLPTEFDAGPDSLVSLAEAREQATISAFAEVFDDDGKVAKPADPSLDPLQGGQLNLREMGPSNHGVFLFLKRMARYRVNDPATGDAWNSPASWADHRFHEIWQLVVGMDEGEFMPGSGGLLHEVRRFELEFEVDYAGNTSTLMAVNGRSCAAVGTECLSDDESQWPIAFLGWVTNPVGDPFVGDAEGCQFSNTCAQPQLPTGAFQREECSFDGSCVIVPGVPVSLRLDLRSLFVLEAEDSLNRPILGGNPFPFADRAGVISAYARHDLVSVGGLDKEQPQLGSVRYRMGQWPPVCETQPSSPCCYLCSNPPNPLPGECTHPPANRDWCQDQNRVDEFYNLTGFNTALQRYDTARSTRALLARQFFGADESATHPAVPKPTTVAEENALRMAVTNNPDQFIRSDWEMLRQTMNRRWGITFDLADIPANGDQIDPGTPSACPDPTILPRAPDAVDINEDLQVVFVLDRSGSMGLDDTLFDEEDRSRLDFVKTAAGDFLDDVLEQVGRDGGVRGPKVALVWYSDEPEVRVPELSAATCAQDADCPASQSCVAKGGSQHPCAGNGDCGGGDVCINAVCARQNESRCADPLRFLSQTGSASTIDINLFKSQMVLSGDGVTAVPEPGGPDGGFTSSGAALEVAAHLFDPGRNTVAGVMPPTRIIVVLSDGLHNRPKGGDCLGPDFCTERMGSQCLVGICGNGTEPCSASGKRANDPRCWPSSVADQRYENAIAFAQSQGIQVYAVPLANKTDRAAAAIAAGDVAGEVFEANRNFGEDVPPVFSQARAATRGEQLANTHHSLPYLETGPLGEEFTYNYLVSPIEVEPGARSMTARVSDYDAQDSEGFEAGPGSQVYLVSPSGVGHSFFTFQPSAGVSNRVNELSAALVVDSPEPGTWRVEDRAPPSGPDGFYMRYYTSVAVENPGINCYAEASLSQTDGTQDITISAQAIYEGPIVEGATYAGTLLRSDFTLMKLDFALDATGIGRAVVRPADLVGSGTYFVNVSCDVAEDARVESGENLPAYGGASAPPALSSPAFRRQVTTGFAVNTDSLISVPGIGGNNQSQSELDEIAGGIDCPLGATCTIPITLAPLVPFLGDADGDGIPNEDEPPVTVDTDGDGRPDVYDSDANGNEVPDGGDSCLDEADPPVITADAVTTETCVPAPTSVVPNVTAADLCTGAVTPVGRLLTSGGATVQASVVVEADMAVDLPPGVSTIEWTATDSLGNEGIAVQTIDVQLNVTEAACCPSGATVVNGSGWFDWIYRPLPGSYCIFGKGFADNIDVGSGADFVSGGSGSDHIDVDGDGDVVVGQEGHDVVLALGLTPGAAVYGGDGDDWIKIVSDGVAYGNAGDDSIFGWSGSQQIVPGPGRDFVEAGSGDDIVRIHHICEVEPFEVLDGGLGNDTLYTPVSVSQLNAMGVVVLGFQNIVISNATEHLSECLP